MPLELDHPFDEVVASADRVIAAGGTVYFKWQCSACGARCSFEKPNTIYRVATHTDCKVDPTRETDLVKNGCNYMLVFALGEPGKPGERRVAVEGIDAAAALVDVMAQFDTEDDRVCQCVEGGLGREFCEVHGA